MKIICLSDTHTYHSLVKIPEADMIIHAGDFTWHGGEKEVRDFINWYSKLPIKHKILIQGNHEVEISRDSTLFKSIVEYTNINYLQDSYVMIEGLKIYGSPYTPEFHPEYWTWQLKARNAADCWAMIPDDTDILVTHGPPKYIRDTVTEKLDLINVGCSELYKRVFEVKPKLHVFGHIHPQYGIYETEYTTFINAAICNSWNDPVNEAILFEI